MKITVKEAKSSGPALKEAKRALKGFYKDVDKAIDKFGYGLESFEKFKRDLEDDGFYELFGESTNVDNLDGLYDRVDRQIARIKKALSTTWTGFDISPETQGSWLCAILRVEGLDEAVGYKATAANEARSDKAMKIGPIKVTVDDPFKSYNGQTSLFVKIEVPLKDKSGDSWDRDTPIDMSDLKGNSLESILKRLYRTTIGTALFNADYVEILKDKYDFGTFAKWEEDMLADKAGINALKTEIKQRLESFKG